MKSRSVFAPPRPVPASWRRPSRHLPRAQKNLSTNDVPAQQRRVSGFRPLVDVSFASSSSSSSSSLRARHRNLRVGAFLAEHAQMSRHAPVWQQHATSASASGLAPAPSRRPRWRVVRLKVCSSERAPGWMTSSSSHPPRRRPARRRDDARDRPRRFAPAAARERATRATQARWARVARDVRCDDEWRRRGARRAGPRGARGRRERTEDRRGVFSRRRRRARGERAGASARASTTGRRIERAR